MSEGNGVVIEAGDDDGPVERYHKRYDKSIPSDWVTYLLTTEEYEFLLTNFETFISQALA
jgi:hypothetical protein